MHQHAVYTSKISEAEEAPVLLGSILQKNADEKYYIPTEKMSKWTYLKGAKKIPRKSANGHEYMFSEGPIAFPDPWDRPGRTMLTSESTLNRSTHVVTDPGTGRLRLLTPVEAERLQGFDDEWTNTGMPDRMRYFCMGNALGRPDDNKNGQDPRWYNCRGTLTIWLKGDFIMPEHRYDKADLIERFDGILEKTLGEIDNIGLFDHVQEFDLQKGIAGAVIEQCVLGYAPDTRQEADIIVVDGGTETKTELKTTGMIWKERAGDEPAHFVAKEYLSVTAVGIPDLPEQTFRSSHFFEKIEHLLLVYYHYLYGRNERISPYDYRDFPVKGYDLHDMTADELQALQARLGEGPCPCR